MRQFFHAEPLDVQRFCEISPNDVDFPVLLCYGCDKKWFLCAAPAAGKVILMTNSFHISRRLTAALLSAVLLCMLALPARAAANLKVSAAFWKEKTDKPSVLNDAVDSAREATLARQSNGTYTLELPIEEFSFMEVSCYLTGISIGDISYDGEVSGDVKNGTGILTLRNLPSSILTGSEVSDSLLVSCSLQTSVNLLGTISTDTRMCVWVE